MNVIVSSGQGPTRVVGQVVRNRPVAVAQHRGRRRDRDGYDENESHEQGDDEHENLRDRMRWFDPTAIRPQQQQANRIGLDTSLANRW